jgi:hypothetical protein
LSKIKFKIDKPGTVTLEIYNLIGIKLDELPAGHLEKGDHTIFWKPKNNFSGSVLNYRIELDKQVIFEQMFVVR